MAASWINFLPKPMTMRQLFFLILFAIFYIFPGLAQDPYLQESSTYTGDRAVELTKAYQDDLGMTIEQSVKFRSKIEEYLIRRNTIREKDLPVKQKLAMLKDLSRMETAEMRNILTLPQYRYYKRLKRKFQPVQVLIKNSN